MTTTMTTKWKTHKIHEPEDILKIRKNG